MLKGLLGFRGASADVFLKLGGSLLGDLAQCKRLAGLLSELSADRRIVVFPGGGPIDKYIESLDTQLHFEPHVHHQACARAQDQTGLIFGSLAGNAAYFSTPVELDRIFQDRKLAVMLPMKLIVDLHVFAQSWEITSDTMAAYFSDLLSVDKFAILTNVNGVYRSLERKEDGHLPVVKASELAAWGRTSVDECLSPFLLRSNLTCHVLHGHDIDAVRDWIIAGECRGTTIVPE